MKIDIFTIYVFLLCLACAFGMVWAIVWRAYAHVAGVSAWAASSLCLACAGAFLVAHGLSGDEDVSLAARICITFGLCLFWVGARRFTGQSAAWPMVAAIVAADLVFALATQGRAVAQSIGFSVSGAVVFGLVIQTLLPHVATSPAARLSVLSLAVAILGEGLRAVIVVMFAMDVLPETLSRPIGLFAVICMSFGIVTCHFGFILAVMERVRFELSTLVVVDELTGLASRRHFLSQLGIELGRAQRTGRAFCLLVVDVDAFKAINDAHGHAAGDLCLRRFGEIASTRLRRRDVVARLGGDEFGIILPETRLDEAMRVAEDLRLAVRESPALYKEQEIVLAVSIGVTEWDPLRASTIEDLVGDADRALYWAKESGRDRVAFFPGPMQPVTE
ncbi:GGDEF domain-containing protein [Aquabacter spiritensis]|uniref:diguanylate cyclase n=1 Tax=Aquabacter spiritensis TaxID=933073 RepID=A0A4R3LND2_9HYPH|nr:GGDEF domain-containing protein [Aquabacter spiritensis]TCT00959.1 diguanylate cyclase (GGDEF)-like protein [Aquabacter spiritensis]